MPEGMDRRHYLPNTRVLRWPTHQVAGTGRPASPQVANRFEAFQKVLTRIGPLQSSAIAQSVTHGDVAAFDSFGRLATCSMEPRPDVPGAEADGCHGLHVRLVVIGHHLLRDHTTTLDRQAKERFGTRRVALLT
jgi:hypothetical protein